MAITKEDAATADKCQPWGCAADEAPKVVRFWIWHNDGYVRMTLREGQPLFWRTQRFTEEGWRSERETWRLEEGVVHNETCSDERDCDGRCSTSSDWLCPWTYLSARITPDKVGTPLWRLASEHQRDYSAEAMGY